MSVPITYPSNWINHNLYNEFPSVEEARNSIPEEDQVKIGQSLGALVPELIQKLGTTLTHGHHSLKEKESIVGKLERGNLVSKPKKRTHMTCPIAWVRTPKGLFATEGMDNPPQEVLRVVTLVEKKALLILQSLPLDDNEKFSKLTITVDPRVICNTNNSYFIEKNDKDRSILSPHGEKKLSSLEQKVIPTYKSIDSWHDVKGFSATWCSADCLPYKGNHYYSHMRE